MEPFSSLSIEGRPACGRRTAHKSAATRVLERGGRRGRSQVGAGRAGTAHSLPRPRLHAHHRSLVRAPAQPAVRARPATPHRVGGRRLRCMRGQNAEDQGHMSKKLVKEKKINRDDTAARAGARRVPLGEGVNSRFSRHLPCERVSPRCAGTQRRRCPAPPPLCSFGVYRQAPNSETPRTADPRSACRALWPVPWASSPSPVHGCAPAGPRPSSSIERKADKCPPRAPPPPHTPDLPPLACSAVAAAVLTPPPLRSYRH